jgi:hypothetical protein
MSDTRDDLDLGKLKWTGPLAIVSAVGAVCAARVAAFAVLDLDPAFPAFGWGPLTMFTTILTAMAVGVFALVAQRAETPVATYKRIALWALGLSMLPDLALPFGPMPVPWLFAFVLMVMHVTAWWPTVKVLTTLTRRS